MRVDSFICDHHLPGPGLDALNGQESKQGGKKNVESSYFIIPADMTFQDSVKLILGLCLVVMAAMFLGGAAISFFNEIFNEQGSLGLSGQDGASCGPDLTESGSQVFHGLMRRQSGYATMRGECAVGVDTPPFTLFECNNTLRGNLSVVVSALHDCTAHAQAGGYYGAELNWTNYSCGLIVTKTLTRDGSSSLLGHFSSRAVANVPESVPFAGFFVGTSLAVPTHIQLAADCGSFSVTQCGVDAVLPLARQFNPGTYINGTPDGQLVFTYVPPVESTVNFSLGSICDPNDPRGSYITRFDIVPEDIDFCSTFSPTWSPTGVPTAGPVAAPTTFPSASPTAGPVAAPTTFPSAGPTAGPIALPTRSPAAQPTVDPSGAPTGTPTAKEDRGDLVPDGRGDSARGGDSGSWKTDSRWGFAALILPIGIMLEVLRRRFHNSPDARQRVGVAHDNPVYDTSGGRNGALGPAYASLMPAGGASARPEGALGNDAYAAAAVGDDDGGGGNAYLRVDGGRWPPVDGRDILAVSEV